MFCIWYNDYIQTMKEKVNFMDNEILQSIGKLLDKKLQPIQQEINNINSRLDSVENKLSNIGNRLGNVEESLDTMEFKQAKLSKNIKELNLDVQQAERNIRRDIHKLNDETETIIEILQQKELIPC